MKATILDRAGNPVEIELSSTLYREAHDSNCTVAQLLERKFDTDAEKYGSVLEQVSADSGLFVRDNKQFGLRSPTIASVMEGRPNFSAGTVVREANPTSRLIFPAVVLEMMENTLAKDFSSQPAAFEKMIAISDTIAGARFEQPIIDLSRPEGARSMGVAQGALPPLMMTLTVAEVARKIPTFSIGLEMTDEAAKATTLDFVTMSLKRQVEAERDARAMDYIKAMVAGDPDLGMASLTTAGQVVTSTALDALATGGVLTHKAWIKFLYRSSRVRQIDFIICTLDTAMKIEQRTGKPTQDKDDPNSPRIDSLFSIINNTIPQGVKMFLVDNTVVADNVVVALDSRYAIRRVRNSEAEYSAAEQFVMKKTSAIRFDFGEICYRLYDLAWDQLTIL